MSFFRPLTFSLLLVLAGCSSEIYLRDGVTDGDTFYLAQQALVDDDPALQSWVSYSLTLSACKLAIGDENPARSSSFECELMARRHLAETWQEQQAAGNNAYLDSLLMVHEAGLLPEYVAANFHRKHWALPADLDLAGYRAFARQQLRNHEPVTRVVGSWNYARNVRLAQ
ncbi:MAG: hypothetical protein WBN23_02325 [Woeseia sp.]